MTLGIKIIITAILQYSQPLQHHVRKPLQQVVQLPELPVRIPIKPQPVKLLSMMLMIMTTQRISMKITMMISMTTRMQRIIGRRIIDSFFVQEKSTNAKGVPFG